MGQSNRQTHGQNVLPHDMPDMPSRVDCSQLFDGQSVVSPPGFDRIAEESVGSPDLFVSLSD